MAMSWGPPLRQGQAGARRRQAPAGSASNQWSSCLGTHWKLVKPQVAESCHGVSHSAGLGGARDCTPRRVPGEADVARCCVALYLVLRLRPEPRAWA